MATLPGRMLQSHRKVVVLAGFWLYARALKAKTIDQDKRSDIKDQKLCCKQILTQHCLESLVRVLRTPELLS